jgi:hypothetical protein
MSLSLYTRLSWRQQVEMKLHLLICRVCARRFTQIKLLGWAVKPSGGSLQDTLLMAAAPSLPDEAKARLNRKLSGNGR